MDEQSIKKMKVSELKEALTSLGLSTAGKKEDLVARLLEHATVDIASPSITSAAKPTVHANQTNLKKSDAPKPQQHEHEQLSTKELLSKDPMSLERLRARQARFGCSVSKTLQALEAEEKKAQRAERFHQ
mgnify:FL=1